MRPLTLAIGLLGGAAVLHAPAAEAQINAATDGPAASSGPAPTAAAGAVPADDPTLRTVAAQRRSGVVLGASGGLAFAGSSGYPNNARFFDNPDYYSSSPLLVGSSGSFFLMGALSDYFSFGPSVTIGTFESAEWKSTGFGVGFRAEVFPFVSLLPVLADTSVFGQIGVGTTELRAKGPYPTADGSQSFFGIGLHHEWRLARLLGGHAAAGPQIEYDLIRTQAVERHWLTMGLRVVWYAGRVQLDH